MEQENQQLEKVKVLAESAVDMCRNVWECDLDYTVNSLEHIDNVIEIMLGYEQPDKKQITYALVCLGCYVGEVITRNFEGVWLNTVDANGLPVGIKAGNLTLNPLNKVFRRYREGKEHDILHYVVCAMTISSAFQN